MKIFSPADDIATKKILNECLMLEGPKYIRLGRNEVPDVYSLNDNFRLGGSNTFGNGVDGTIFATGATVSIALDAKLILKSFGIDVRVVDLYSIKPVDVETIVKCASETKILVSVEDHNVIGGIGSVVSNVLCEKYPKKLVKIGVQDKFGKSGKADKLYELYGITKENIVRVFKES